MAGVQPTLRAKRKETTKAVRESKATKEELGDVSLFPGRETMIDLMVDGTLPASLIRHASITAEQRVALGMLRDQMLNAAQAFRDGDTSLFVVISNALTQLHKMLGKKRYAALLHETQEMKTTKETVKVAYNENQKLRAAMNRACQVCRTACSKACTCERANYCSRECQLKDWSRHKLAEHKTA